MARPGRPTRLTEDLANQLARHVAEGGSLRGAGKAIGERLDPALICRWKAQSRRFHALMGGANLLATLRLLGHPDLGRLREEADREFGSLATWAHQAIYGETLDTRREAAEVLEYAVFDRGVAHIPAKEARATDAAIGEVWDAE